MSGARNAIDLAVSSLGFNCDCIISYKDIEQGINRQTPGKSDSNDAIKRNNFISAGNDLSVYVSLFIAGLLIHGSVSKDLLLCPVTSIPKGKNIILTDPANYSWISFRSIYDNIFDWIVLLRNIDKLCTRELQVWLKRKHSTNMCTMVLKEGLSYYSINYESVFCSFLDGTKAFDWVSYVKLFKLVVMRIAHPLVFGVY